MGNELITQLRHNLNSKTDLLHAYNAAALDDHSPIRNKVSFETLQKKIRALEEENKLLQSDAAELAKEALECKIKEENLVPDAVKQLHEAKSQINSLSIRIVDKAEESKKQKEEI